jgi:hypothetical protein
MKNPLISASEASNRPSSGLKPPDNRQPLAPRRSRGAQPGRRSRGAQPGRRSRGAQPGNLNALKHGFYSRQFRKAELTDLDTCQFAGLNDEIAMLRVYLRRLVESGQDVSSFTEMLNLGRVLCLTSSSLTRMLRAQQALGSVKDEWSRAILQAISELSEEWEMEKRERLDPPAENPSDPLPPRLRSGT